MSENVDLSGLTTLRIGGPARLLAECPTTQSLIDVVTLLDREQIPTLILAGGSNLVISDAGFDGVVVRVANTTVSLDTDRVIAEAGAVWDEVVGQSVAAELGGLECLSGIPGSTGATPVQNVGAYGVEVGSRLRQVQLLDRRSGEVSWVEPSKLELGYRIERPQAFRCSTGSRRRIRCVDRRIERPARVPRTVHRIGAEEGERLPCVAGPRGSSGTCGRARRWCSIRTTTTPGARVPSSPTPWCRTTSCPLCSEQSPNSSATSPCRSSRAVVEPSSRPDG